MCKKKSLPHIDNIENNAGKENDGNVENIAQLEAKLLNKGRCTLQF